jgi:hypothetical protein
MSLFKIFIQNIIDCLKYSVFRFILHLAIHLLAFTTEAVTFSNGCFDILTLADHIVCKSEIKPLEIKQ